MINGVSDRKGLTGLLLMHSGGETSGLLFASPISAHGKRRFGLLHAWFVHRIVAAGGAWVHSWLMEFDFFTITRIGMRKRSQRDQISKWTSCCCDKEESLKWGCSEKERSNANLKWIAAREEAARPRTRSFNKYGLGLQLMFTTRRRRGRGRSYWPKLFTVKRGDPIRKWSIDL